MFENVSDIYNAKHLKINKMNTLSMAAENVSRKSEPLTKRELTLLKKYRRTFDTDVSCALSLGIDRNVLMRVVLVGSGKPDTIQKIRIGIAKV